MDVAVRSVRLLEILKNKLPGPEVDERVPTLVNACRADFDVALERFAEIALSDVEKHVENFPDILGQSYHFIAQRLFDAVILGEADGVARLAPRFLDLAVAGINRLLAAGIRPIPWTSQIAEDVFELSGYGIIASGVHRRDLWTPIRSRWDAFVASYGEANLLRLAQTIAAAKRVPRITPRSLLRHAWWLAFRTALQDHGLLPPDGYGRIYGPRPEPRVDVDPVVATVVGSGDFDEDDVMAAFAALYVHRRHPNVFPAFGEDAQRFLEELERVRSARRRRNLRRDPAAREADANADTFDEG
jgi:hypothetical protein